MTRPDADILVVGSLNMDLVTRVDSFPRAGETLLGSDYQTFFGGKGANQAVAAARQGARVAFVGRVGDDAFGPPLRENLEREGVATAGVLTTDGPSGVAFITLNRDSENTIIVAPGANAALTPDALSEANFVGVKLLLVQLEVPLATVQRALQLARAAGVQTVVNAAPAAVTPDQLAGTDLLVVNEGEAAALTASEQTAPDELAERLLEHVPKVVITLGKDGLVWAERGGQRRDRRGASGAFSVRAVDTTAAGDAFVGGLVSALVAERSWEEGLERAAAAGALATTRPGAQPSLPTAAEVAAFLEAQKA